jgi:mannose-6-phosphate isomerase-like protein (cupin superfamily)
VNADEASLRALCTRLEATEVELKQMGYRVEREVAHPGTLISQQTFEQETLILVLHGRMFTRSGDEGVELGPGSQLLVPSGVPYSLQVVGETSVYWLHAIRREEPESPHAQASKE